MRKKIALLLSAVLILTCFFSVSVSADSSEYETETAAKVHVGTSGDAFQIEMTTSVSQEDRTVTLWVRVNNFDESKKFLILELLLNYDTERLTNITPKNDDGTYNCIVSYLPGTDWENLVADYTKDPSLISISVGVASDLTQYLKKDSELIFEFQFTLKDDYTEAGFWITDERSRVFDEAFAVSHGNGSYAIARFITPDTCTHDYEDVVTLPTYESQGYTTHTCKICQYSYIDSYTDPLTQGLAGDVNGDGTVNAKDYLMLKRHILGTYTIDDSLVMNGDMDKDGVLKAKDYLILKRTVLGTYNPA